MTLERGNYGNQKSAKKKSSKKVAEKITIELKEGYTLEDLRAAITPAIFKRLRASHKPKNQRISMLT